MAPWVRTIKAAVDPTEERERQTWRRQRHRLLPPPEPAAVAVAISILEVRAGLRPAQQLERRCHHTLWPALDRLPDPPRGRPIPLVPRPRAVALQQPTPGLVDAAVVIEFAGRTHALGLRLDGARGFWELVELDYAAGSALDLPAPGHGDAAPRLVAAASPPHCPEPGRLRRPAPPPPPPPGGRGIELA